MRTHYTRGREVEYLARDRLKTQGFQVFRSAGAHSPVDLIAWRRSGYPFLLQVRRTRNLLDHPALVARFYHADIEALRSIDLPHFASMQLWVWIERRGWRFFDVMPGGICEVADNVA